MWPLNALGVPHFEQEMDKDITTGNVIRDLSWGISSVICSVVCCWLFYPDFKSLNFSQM